MRDKKRPSTEREKYLQIILLKKELICISYKELNRERDTHTHTQSLKMNGNSRQTFFKSPANDQQVHEKLFTSLIIWKMQIHDKMLLYCSSRLLSRRQVSDGENIEKGNSFTLLYECKLVLPLRKQITQKSNNDTSAECSHPFTRIYPTERNCLTRYG